MIQWFIYALHYCKLQFLPSNKKSWYKTLTWITDCTYSNGIYCMIQFSVEISFSRILITLTCTVFILIERKQKKNISNLVCTQLESKQFQEVNFFH